MTDLTLKTNFAEGDVLWALGTTSTSGVNGITTQINANTTRLKYGGSDLTEASIANSTTETTIGSVTIPAGTFATGALIFAHVGIFTLLGETGTFRIKTGAAGSEATRATMVLTEGVTSLRLHSPFNFYDTAATYTNEVSIIVTGQNSTASVDRICYCTSLIVMGF